MLRSLSVEESIQRSCHNCHVMGLDSIVLAEDTETGELVRVFWTTPEHELYKNEVPFSTRISIAVHPHHCDITLVPLFGTILNSLLELDDDPNGEVRIDSWEYVSGIATPKGSFRRTGSSKNVLGIKFQPLVNDLTRGASDGNVYTMKYNELHTVYVPRGETSAWAIFEGPSHGREKPRECYSNNDLTKFKFEDHYTPMKNTTRVLQAMRWYQSYR